MTSKVQKALDKLAKYFSKAEHHKQIKLKKMKKVLKDLKEREIVLNERLKGEVSDSKRKHLQKEVDIIHAQRKKGKKLYQELKEKTDD